MSQRTRQSLNEQILAVPAAVRSRHPGWRDPRILIGLALVAGCVLLGAKVFTAADDTVTVWSARGDLPAGAAVDSSVLEKRQVHFSADAASSYFIGSQLPASGSSLTHDVSAGELLPRSAVRSAGTRKLVEVPLSVAPDDLPGTVRQGSVVDVWVTPKEGGGGAPANGSKPRARLLLDDVVVVGLPRTGDSLAPESTRQVILGLDPEHEDQLATALGGMADGRVVIIRQVVGR